MSNLGIKLNFFLHPIGENFPCTQINDDIPVEDRSTTWGYAGTDFAPNTDVVLSFSVRFHKFF